MGKAPTSGKTAANMKDNGSTEICTVTESILGIMDANLKEISLQTKDQARVFRLGLMAVFMMVTGATVNNMV